MLPEMAWAHLDWYAAGHATFAPHLQGCGLVCLREGLGSGTGDSDWPHRGPTSPLSFTIASDERTLEDNRDARALVLAALPRQHTVLEGVVAVSLHHDDVARKERDDVPR